MHLSRLILFAGLIFMSMFGCRRAPEPEPAKGPGLYYPDYIPKPIYDFSKNPVTADGFDLGKMLFYDPILSRDSSISCGKCHAQVHAFADHGMALSTGIDNKIGARNSPPVFNLAWMPSFMWDGGINHIEVMPLGPIMNHVEMDDNMKNIVEKLNRSPYYRSKFKKAFNVDVITDDLVLKAIVQFMGTITSFDSKYDKMRKGEYVFSDDELKGYEMFKSRCNNCHTEPLFSSFEYANNGLDSVFKDFGRYLISLNEKDKGKFKIPSLRNVSLTNPYMHDGRFQTLYDVMDHYQSGVLNSSTLHPLLKDGIPISDTEKYQIVAFLKTLTDYEMLGNHSYSEP